MDTLNALVTEAKQLLGESAGGPVPLAVKWVLVRVRKDAKARKELLDGVEATAERVIEELTTPPQTVTVAPKRGKKGAAVVAPPPSPVGATSKVSDLTAEDLLEKVIARLDKNQSRVVTDAIDELRMREEFEEWVVDQIARQIFSSSLGPWEFWPEFDSGHLLLQYKFAGEEQAADTNHPGDTDDGAIDTALTRVLGAANADTSWELDGTPSDWGFPSGDKFVVSYSGRANWFYGDGQAALFAVGRKALLSAVQAALKTKQDEEE